MKKPSTLFARLARWYSAVIVVCLTAFGLTVYFAAVSEDENEHGAEVVDPRLDADPARLSVLLALALALPATLALTLIGGLVVGRRALRPIEEVVRLASALDTGSLSGRVPVPPDAASEIIQLGGALNGMLERLEASVQTLQRFTAAAAHELRTPLTLVMGELELALHRPRSPDELLLTISHAHGELERLSRVVEALLTLARADAKALPIDWQTLELGALVSSALEPYEPVWAERQLSVSTALSTQVWVRTDRLWLTRAVANLIDNACKFAPTQGRIEVRVESRQELAVISVTDSGQGLGGEERRRLFERFYRNPASGKTTAGSGLGLALASDLVRALGGRLYLDETSLQTRFCIELTAQMPP